MSRMIDPKILKTRSGPEAVAASGGTHRDRAPPAAFPFQDIGALLGDALKAWYRHNAPRLGASLAFYTMFSLAPLLIVVIGVASLIFGRAAAEGQIIGQIRELTGREGAEVIRQVVAGAREPVSGILATSLGLLTLFLGATAVVAELRDALNTIWEVPAHEGQWGRGIAKILKERVLSFVMVLSVGFLLLVSLNRERGAGRRRVVLSRSPADAGVGAAISDFRGLFRRDRRAVCGDL
jgi:membrane protein